MTKGKDFISTILGKPTLVGDFNWARKAHARKPTLARRHQKVNLVERMPKLPKASSTPIMFMEENARDVVCPYNNALVTTMKIASKDVAHILIDTGSSVNILSKEAFNKLSLNSVKM